MKKASRIAVLITAAVMTAVFVFGIIFTNCTADTKYAVGFSKAFADYDIHDVDAYFSNDTVIECNGKRNTYENLRQNVMNACAEKSYRFFSSYGHGNDKFTNGVQTVSVVLYGSLEGEDIGECGVVMSLRKTGMMRFKIESVRCDEAVFEYLFYADDGE